MGADELDVVGVDVEADLGGALRDGEAQGRNGEGVGGELQVDLAEPEHPGVHQAAIGAPPAVEAAAEHLAKVGGGDLGDQLEGLGALLGAVARLEEVVIEDRQGVGGVVERDAEGPLDIIHAGCRQLVGNGGSHEGAECTRRKALATEDFG